MNVVNCAEKNIQPQISLSGAWKNWMTIPIIVFVGNPNLASSQLLIIKMSDLNTVELTPPLKQVTLNLMYTLQFFSYFKKNE